jgi:hypothetical protein
VCLHTNERIEMDGGKRGKVALGWRSIIVDQHSALRVQLSDIIEGLEFQSDECFSYLNTTTGEIVSVTTEELRAAEEDAPSRRFPGLAA